MEGHEGTRHVKEVKRLEALINAELVKHPFGQTMSLADVVTVITEFVHQVFR